MVHAEPDMAFMSNELLVSLSRPSDAHTSTLLSATPSLTYADAQSPLQRPRPKICEQHRRARCSSVDDEPLYPVEAEHLAA